MEKSLFLVILSLLFVKFSYSQELEINKGVLICNNDTLQIHDNKTNIYDLLSEKRGENMFFANNETHYSFLDTCHLTYVLNFNIEKELLHKDVIKLSFKYIDTHATILLNGKQVAKTQNAFRTYSFDVKEFLKKGENELRVEIEPIYQKWQNINSDDFNILHSEKRVVFRKAAFQFGWDWAPRYMNMGIWQPVYLKAWTHSTICSASVITDEIQDNKAILLFETCINADEDHSVTIRLFQNDVKVLNENINLVKGENNICYIFIFNFH